MGTSKQGQGNDLSTRAPSTSSTASSGALQVEEASSPEASGVQPSFAQVVQDTHLEGIILAYVVNKAIEHRTFGNPVIQGGESSIPLSNLAKSGKGYFNPINLSVRK